MDKKQTKQKRLDLIGAGCGVVLVLIFAANLILGSTGGSAGAKASDIPADAQTLSGVAEGRNGPVEVEVIATADKIYQIKVVGHKETDGIGTIAVEELPGRIYEAQGLDVDATSGATITSEAIRAAVMNALASGGLDGAFGAAAPVKEVQKIANKVETKSGVTALHASDWAEQYPDIYESWTMTRSNDEVVDYLAEYPMLPTLYEPYGFAYSYGSARGHFYDVTDIEETGRPHKLANCWTCKTPDFTNMVNEMGDAAYQLDWTDVQQQVVEGISCYNCHANTPGVITITHTYWIDALGEDFDKVAPANLACGQCHNEYFFDPATKATTIAHNSLESMAPETMLAYFNDASNFSNGEIFTDYTNPRTGVKQIKVQHPEFETFLGEGSQHARDFTCADCHMPDAVNAEGVSYRSHELTSPLDNAELIANTCSQCHKDLAADVKAVQAKAEERTYAIGYALQDLTEQLAAAVESGDYTEEELDAVRALARDAQFYWDFVFVENSEGAHNSKLTHACLDKAESLTAQAVALLSK